MEVMHPSKTSNHVPILSYHRIARDGPPELAPYRVSPEMFERHLTYLIRNGYGSIHLDDIQGLLRAGSRPKQKTVALTFDDAYSDFYSDALPLVSRYGFTSTVFVPVHYVGGRADWDSGYGDPAPIMSWEQIRGAKALGAVIGSHGSSHRRLPRLSAEELHNELIWSRARLEEEIGGDVRLLAYPFNDHNKAVRAAAAATGYKLAVGGGLACAGPDSDTFALPRLEILASDGIDGFIEKIECRP